MKRPFFLPPDEFLAVVIASDRRERGNPENPPVIKAGLLRPLRSAPRLRKDEDGRFRRFPERCRVARPLLYICMIVSLAWSHASAKEAVGLQPAMYYEETNVLLGEGWCFGSWHVDKPVKLFERRDPDSPIITILKPGTLITAESGDMLTLRPGKAEVLRSRTIQLENGESMRLDQGNALELLSYEGEGQYRVYFHDHIFSDEIGSPEGCYKKGCQEKMFGYKTEREPETQWWVKIRYNAMDSGWSNQSERFNPECMAKGRAR